MFEKKNLPSPVDQEIQRVLDAMPNFAPGSNAHRLCVEQLEKLQAISKQQAEMRQKFTKADRGEFLKRILGFFGFGALIFGLSKYQNEGNIDPSARPGTVRKIIERMVGFFM